MISLNDLIKYAKVNDLNFDAPLKLLVENGQSKAMILAEQIGTAEDDTLVLLEKRVSYDEKTFKEYGITGVVNTMRFVDLEGNFIDDEQY